MAQTADLADSAAGGNARARHYFIGCGPLRAGKGITKNALATESDVDRTTLNKIEGGKTPVTEERVMRVFNCLNEKYYGSKLNIADHVTTTKPK